MLLRNLSAVVLCLTAGLLPAGAADTPAKIKKLLDHSPFGAPPVNLASSKAPDPLEFRAVLEEDGTRYFSVYDANTHCSAWVKLNEPLNEFVIKDFDAAHTIVQIEYKGAALTLPIKQGQASAMVNSAPLPASGGIALTSRQQAEDKAIAVEVEKYKIRAAMAAAARQRAILAQPVPSPN
jgi:hypothetical protein